MLYDYKLFYKYLSPAYVLRYYIGCPLNRSIIDLVYFHIHEKIKRNRKCAKLCNEFFEQIAIRTSWGWFRIWKYYASNDMLVFANCARAKQKNFLDVLRLMCSDRWFLLFISLSFCFSDSNSSCINIKYPGYILNHLPYLKGALSCS